MEWAWPLLLSDVGGTNVRFALAREPGAAIETLRSAHTAEFPSFEAAAARTLAAAGTSAKGCVMCAAGPVRGTSVTLTNAKWTIDGPAVARALGLEKGLLLNDFEALALSIPSVRRDRLRPIGPQWPSEKGTRIIHGPGTGLGTAALIEVEGKWRAVASEGSHSDFAAVGDDETAVWPYVERKLGRLTPETLISGPGLRRLHRARAAARGEPRPDIDEAEIIARGLANESGSEAETIRMFWRVAGRYAGDLALTFLATGGVFLAGGMLPRIAGLLDEGAFRAAFEQKAPYEELARGVPVALVLDPEGVLRGMADLASHPGRYAVDFDARRWA